MLFNSNAFYVFFPIVFAVYWIIPAKYRWGILLISSYYFYMSWNVKYVTLILTTTLVSFCAALLMERTKSRRKKKLCMITALVISFGILFFFKYFNFLSKSITDLLQRFAIPVQETTLNLMLPVGISFYTFQTLSYVIDVYRGDVKACRHLGKYAAFISFFPQLVAGPIERTGNLLPQIEGEHTFHTEKGIHGAKMIAWGFFKKIAIADTVAVYVDTIYNAAGNYTGFPLLLSTVLFTFQIYCDFSGYSDIALGTAELLDIDLMTNFKSPYFSASIREFWSRWHISLSTWFRDYVYIPLGGNRVPKWRHCLNLLLTFLVSGFWHGSSLTYLLWGALHGLLQIAEVLLHPKSRQTPGDKKRWWQLPLTFALLCFTWIFFRANNMEDALWVLSRLFWDIGRPLNYLKTAVICLDMPYASMFGMLLAAAVLLVYDLISLEEDVIALVSRQKFFVRWPIYVLLLVVIALFSHKGIATEFIYFQF